MDREIAQFVAAHWTEMELPDSGEIYWYNQVQRHSRTWHESISDLDNNT